jgi:hypothetical protein
MELKMASAAHLAVASWVHLLGVFVGVVVCSQGVSRAINGPSDLRSCL